VSRYPSKVHGEYLGVSGRDKGRSGGFRVAEKRIEDVYECLREISDLEIYYREKLAGINAIREHCYMILDRMAQLKGSNGLLDEVDRFLQGERE
jgi:hypothetical protein